MFQRISLERVALALFAGAVTLIAATMAFAKTPVLDDAEQALPATPAIFPMLCRATAVVAEKQIRAKFTIDLKTNHVSTGAVVTADVLGKCGSDTAKSSYGVTDSKGRQVDAHTYVAGGADCREADGTVQFTLNYDRKAGVAHEGSLTVAETVYTCEPMP